MLRGLRILLLLTFREAASFCLHLHSITGRAAEFDGCNDTKEGDKESGQIAANLQLSREVTN